MLPPFIITIFVKDVFSFNSIKGATLKQSKRYNTMSVKDLSNFSQRANFFFKACCHCHIASAFLLPRIGLTLLSDGHSVQRIEVWGILVVTRLFNPLRAFFLSNRMIWDELTELIFIFFWVFSSSSLKLKEQSTCTNVLTT